MSVAKNLFSRLPALSDPLRALLGGLLLFGVCLAAHQSPRLIEPLIREKVSFHRTDVGQWSASLHKLPPGTYYLSVGRPRGACDIVLGDKILDSNQSVRPEVRDSLLLGASFEKLPGESLPELKIQCSRHSASRAGFTHLPVVATYRAGMALQLARTFAELLLGPAFSLVLLISVLIRRRTTREMTSRAIFVAFAATAFVFSLSLAHYPRLFLDDQTASLLQVVLRNLFSLAVVGLLGAYCRQRPALILAHGVSIAVAVYLGLDRPEHLWLCFSIQFLFYPLAAAIMTADLVRAEVTSESVLLLRYFGVAAALAEAFDAMVIWLNFGAASGPAMLAGLSTLVGYLHLKEAARSARIEQAFHRILAAVDCHGSPREILPQLATLAASETHFKRVSAYIDGFCLGITESPGTVFVRVAEKGYSKDTASDTYISFNDGRGQHMAEALKCQDIILRKGTRDNAWFLVVPIGKHMTLNLSDEVARPPFDAHISAAILRRLMPALLSFDTRLVSQRLGQGAGLERLRLSRGDGKWECEIGAVFADVNDYSHLSDRYGPSFPEFVAGVYFPALIKAVGVWAAPEFIRGDEVYFVSLAELIPPGSSVERAALETTSAILEFASGPGAQLCVSHGFDPVTLSVGANTGAATLICDPLKVRTAGQTVNEAKRLQEAAGSETALVKSQAFSATELGSFRLGEEHPVLIKKNCIIARQLLRPGASASDGSKARTPLRLVA